MKILGKQENFRVVVEPRILGDMGFVRTSDSFFYRDPVKRAAAYRDACNEIAAQIKRHVDEVGHVSVEFDQEPICQHCGSRWTEKSDAYNGGCCDKDEDEHQIDVAAAGGAA